MVEGHENQSEKLILIHMAHGSHCWGFKENWSHYRRKIIPVGTKSLQCSLQGLRTGKPQGRTGSRFGKSFKFDPIVYKYDFIVKH